MTTTIGGSYPAVNSDSDATINGLTVGKGTNGVAGNTAVGSNALAGSNSGGGENTAIGLEALNANTTGADQVGVGYRALAANTTGTENVSIGAAALRNSTTGNYNVAVGRSALNQNTTASYNTAVGYQAGYSNTTGSVTAFGMAALYSNTTGVYNTAIGGRDATAYSPMGANTTGGYNTVLGNGALGNNTTASNNTAVGYQAGYSNTTGGSNVFIGGQAGFSSVATTVNAGNTVIGYQAGYSLTTGVANVFIGSNNAGSVSGSGAAITSGSKNTIIGSYSGNQGGLDIRTASNYIVLSDGDGNPTASCDNAGAWAFGAGTKTNDGLLTLYVASGTNLGPVFIGRTGALNSSTARWYTGSNSWIKGGTAYDTYTVAAGAAASGGVYLTSGATSWVSVSDARLKNVTGTYTTALADIAHLQPVKFTWKSDTENKPQVGVLAQSVQAVVPEAIDHIRVDKADETEYLGVRYTELIPLMIASIQELKAEFDAYKATHP